ncbi:unnamed protein product [Alopecurus aequalis]
MATGGENRGMPSSSRAQPKTTSTILFPVPDQGVLAAPLPGGGGDQGGSAAVPARPKPTRNGAIVPLRRRDTVVIEEVHEEDGNWDDNHDMEEEEALPQDRGTNLGGVAEMEDDVYLEEEDDDVVQEEAPRSSWQLIARYYAQRKLNAKDMFENFEDVWHLRKGVKYKELQKNYYIITLFTQGDFYFVNRGGPWIFNRNALLVKALDDKVRPSETVLNSVPIWVRIYDVPWGKQNEGTGMRWGNPLGRALEVDTPNDVDDKNEFLRVRVELPYDRRLQTQLTIGVKGKPNAPNVYKLKYERVPYYCLHCGCMGRGKEVCEKRRRGAPSLEYGAYQLRCSPYKKYEHRANYVPSSGQPTARRGLSFASFGSANSHTSRRPSAPEAETSRRLRRQAEAEERRNSHTYVSEQVGSRDGFHEEEMPGLEEIDQGLSQQIQSLGMGTTNQGEVPSTVLENAAQFEVQKQKSSSLSEKRKKSSRRTPLYKGEGSGLKVASLGTSDMIPALQGMSNWAATYGVSDDSMSVVDQVPRKRTTTEKDVFVFGQNLAIVPYDDDQKGGEQKRGRASSGKQANQKHGMMEVDDDLEATDPGATGKLTGPSVAPRQQQ